ncbi:MAG: TIGR04283 family arsenosugar biosynthesis glycosyltransferase [Chitinophagales bacterium]|jgi:rSAM/selenodomain-associated transferase 2|nr:TIGR04283 family arsenosugar biosynthesis glycosyltransferase [Chitinophagales bacterium]MBP9221713.1 TIGR04283 family arsenosugar biosynthesis glycosyltransferase [Chitinophagales bacterium]MBP9797152.1 TIGR04283 family arsenosugar biosynthesis glycosyltransferase [Chitinophagales bacterium]
MKISIIIPTLNEEKYISKILLWFASINSDKILECIVCDGGSEDNTIKVASQFNTIILHSPKKGRSNQMNFAAKYARGEILYFVHADCIPPKTCFDSIIEAVHQNYDAGCFRYKFDSDKYLLKVNAFFNRFGGLICRGGDQTLFVKKEIFFALNGFSEKFIIMEDYDFVKRLMKIYSFKVIPEYAVVSARKYEHNSWAKVNFANAVAMYMFMSGAYSPQRIRNTYHSMIKHPKGQ